MRPWRKLGNNQDENKADLGFGKACLSTEAAETQKEDN